MLPDAVRAPRPVTPVGVAADLLTSVVARLDGEESPDEDGLVAMVTDLRRATAIVSGLEAYVDRCTTAESSALRRLAARTAEEDWAPRGGTGGPHLEQEMLSGHVEGAFLRFLVHLTRATRVLEIGMFTGYSALAMAEALPEDGRLVACELDPYAAGFARECFAASPAGARIDVEVGPALDTLHRLAAAGERFDLVFVDADKAGYRAYLDVLLDGGVDGGVDGGLLAAGAVVCVDNTLLQGEPWAGAASDNGRAIADFNAALAADPRVEQVVVPLRDGITLVRRA